MTPSDPADAPTRRPRRAVRQAGTVGGDDAVLVSTLPALPDIDAALPAQVAAPAPAPAPDPVVALRSADDSDLGWGEREGGSNDDRLSRDKPPHW